MVRHVDKLLPVFGIHKGEWAFHMPAAKPQAPPDEVLKDVEHLFADAESVEVQPPIMVPEDTPVEQLVDEPLMEVPVVEPPQRRRVKKKQKRLRKTKVVTPLRRRPVTRMMNRSRREQ